MSLPITTEPFDSIASSISTRKDSDVVFRSVSRAINSIVKDPLLSNDVIVIVDPFSVTVAGAVEPEKPDMANSRASSPSASFANTETVFV